MSVHSPSLAQPLEFNSEFARALHMMQNTGMNLFITGKAGTGKSTLLAHFRNTSDKKPVLLAPTGVAALNVQGQTIHRFFNFSIDVSPQKILDKKSKPRDAKLYKKLRTIIIDEVSMLRADLLDCIDLFLQLYGPLPRQPFGGVQMVFVGDLYQLPPVVGRDEQHIFTSLYETPYFFSANVMRSVDVEMIELDKVYRQKDPEFVGLLNRIRNNSVEMADIAHLNQRYGAPQLDVQNIDEDAAAVAALSPSSKLERAKQLLAGIKPARAKKYSITLTTTNQRADEINDAELAALAGKPFTVEAKIKGNFGKEYYPTATELQFKIGAQIMLLNNDSRNRWVNGSIGTITNFRKNADGDYYVHVHLRDSAEDVQVFAYEWEVYRFFVAEEQIMSEAAGSFTQFPFRLAWAVTIHKSQGKTFDDVVIDLGRGTFAAGQLYVALSRCTSFEGIRLKSQVRAADIRSDARIYKFLTHQHYKKAEVELPFEQRFDVLLEAIAAKAALRMVYLKANDTKLEQIIQPVWVGDEDYQGKIFPCLRALCQPANDERAFHIGRILKLEPVS